MKIYTYNLRQNQIVLTLVENKVLLQLKDQIYTSVYPCSIEHVQRTYFDLMIWILFYGFDENVLDNNGNEIPTSYGTKISTGWDKILLSYSGGVDSTALLLMMENLDVTPVYLKRSYDDIYCQNQIEAIKAFNSKIIETDFELIRKQYGKSHGFNIGIGYCCLLIPLIPILQAKYITFGAIMEGVALSYDTSYKYITRIGSRFAHIFKVLKNYDIEISLPMAGLSEVHTSRIVEYSSYKYVACSCHVQMDGNKCMKCYKCFRKEAILGRQIEVSDILYKKLRIKPLAAAPATIYGIQKAKYQGGLWDRYKSIPTDWVNYYDRILTEQYNPEEICTIITGLFRSYDIGQITALDRESIELFCDCINDDKLYI